MDISEIVQRQKTWSLKTFGPGHHTNSLLAHIRKELAEIEESPLSIDEWIDVALLALEGAWRAGHTPYDVERGLITKQCINIYERKWTLPANEDEPAEHDRDMDVINMTEVRKCGER